MTARTMRWVRLLATFSGMSLAGQVAGMLAGLIYVRYMPVGDYASYALCLTSLSFLSLATDLGLTGSLTYFWRECRRRGNAFAPVLAEVRRLRLYLLLPCAVAVLVGLPWLLSESGYGTIEVMLLSGLVIALCCLGITVIATRMLARQLQESIAGPFDRVAEIAHEASNERRLSSRLDPTGVVEIDRFASDFNSLIAELESWHATLTSENAELSRRADHDPLTGLGNRARFERLFEAAIKVAEKSGKQVALLFVDCDGFKEINDRHGHDVGDAVICTIAERLRHSIREKDRVFRLGGDEFAVVLDNLVSLDAVGLVADRVRASMDEPVTVALGQEHRLSLSIGHASYPEDGNTPRLLVRVADQRMYRVKRGEKTSENDNA